MQSHSLLHDIRPAKCNTAWDSMAGTDVVRTCPKCNTSVYKADGLNETQLLELITSAEPAVELTQLRLYRRNDGTMMLSPGNHLSRYLVLLRQPLDLLAMGICMAGGSAIMTNVVCTHYLNSTGGIGFLAAWVGFAIAFRRSSVVLVFGGGFLAAVMVLLVSLLVRQLLGAFIHLV